MKLLVALGLFGLSLSKNHFGLPEFGPGPVILPSDDNLVAGSASPSGHGSAILPGFGTVAGTAGDLGQIVGIGDEIFGEDALFSFGSVLGDADDVAKVVDVGAEIFGDDAFFTSDKTSDTILPSKKTSDAILPGFGTVAGAAGDLGQIIGIGDEIFGEDALFSFGSVLGDADDVAKVVDVGAEIFGDDFHKKSNQHPDFGTPFGPGPIILPGDNILDAKSHFGLPEFGPGPVILPSDDNLVVGFGSPFGPGPVILPGDNILHKKQPSFRVPFEINSFPVSI